MSKMYPKLPKGVVLDRSYRNKEPRYYFRAPGRPKVRLRETPFTDEFEAEVAAARLGVPYVKPGTEEPKPLDRKAAKGTFQWLVQQYKARAGNTMAADQLARRVRLLEEVCDSLTSESKKRRGDLPYAMMEKRHITEIRDTIRDTPGAQDNALKYISAMFGWAVENDLADRNPALRIKKVNSAGKGFHTWTVEEVRQFEEKHKPGTKANLYLTIALFTGLRLQELAILGRQHVRDGWLNITPGKTKNSSGVTVQMPLLKILRDKLDALPATNLTYMVTEYGKPFTVNGLGNKMRDWCDAAGLPHCSTHGLRKAGATIAAENGATDDELMAIFGWTTKKQTTLYTRQANRKKLAAGAVHKLMPEQTSTDFVPPISGVE